jgi:hypothetical protein
MLVGLKIRKDKTWSYCSLSRMVDVYETEIVVSFEMPDQIGCAKPPPSRLLSWPASSGCFDNEVRLSLPSRRKPVINA